ncbi:MAG: YmaF family protein [Clostridia bacterium]|nr:YmaF family protein [Clostridia bacterium]
MYPHIHKYKLECENSDNHTHRMVGCTENLIGFSSFHFHYYYGITSYNNHTHYYTGITGLPIKTENGHIHRIEGLLEVNNMHDHKYTSSTSEDVEYFSDKRRNEAYV